MSGRSLQTEAHQQAARRATGAVPGEGKAI